MLFLYIFCQDILFNMSGIAFFWKIDNTVLLYNGMKQKKKNIQSQNYELIRINQKPNFIKPWLCTWTFFETWPLRRDDQCIRFAHFDNIRSRLSRPVQNYANDCAFFTVCLLLYTLCTYVSSLVWLVSYSLKNFMDARPC